MRIVDSRCRKLAALASLLAFTSAFGFCARFAQAAEDREYVVVQVDSTGEHYIGERIIVRVEVATDYVEIEPGVLAQRADLSR